MLNCIAIMFITAFTLPGACTQSHFDTHWFNDYESVVRTGECTAICYTFLKTFNEP
jgi:hypothetical protein